MLLIGGSGFDRRIAVGADCVHVGFQIWRRGGGAAAVGERRRGQRDR